MDLTKWNGKCRSALWRLLFFIHVKLVPIISLQVKSPMLKHNHKNTDTSKPFRTKVSREFDYLLTEVLEEKSRDFQCVRHVFCVIKPQATEMFLLIIESYFIKSSSTSKIKIHSYFSCFYCVLEKCVNIYLFIWYFC